MFFEKIGRQVLNLFVILLPWSVLMSVFGGEKLGFEIIRFWKEILLFFIFVAYIIVAYKKKEKISIDTLDGAILLYIFWLLLITAFNHVSISSYVYGLRYDAEFLLAFMFLRRAMPLWSVSFSSLAKKFLISGGVMLIFSLAIRYIFGEAFLTIFGFTHDINATTSYGPPPIYHAINDSHVIRFQGVLEGPNQMAFFLIVYLALYLTLFWKSRGYKFLNSIVACVLLGLIFETYSRSAYLGVGLSSIVLILMSLYNLFVSKNFLKKIRKYFWKIVGVIFGVVIVFAGVFFQFQGKFYDIFHRQGSTSGHFERMAIGWTRFLMHPAGSGLAQAGPASRSVTRVDGASIEFESIPELPIRELAYDLKSKNPDFYFTTSNYYIPESWYVQQLVEGGMIGSILFISVFLIFLAKISPYRYVFGSLGAVMVMNIFLHSFESVHSVLALFTMCAALLPVSNKNFSLEKMIVPVLGVLLFFIPWHALIITLFQCKLYVDISLLRFWKEIIVALFFLIAGFVLIQKDGKNILSWYRTRPVLFWTIIFCISSLVYTFYPVAIFGQRTLLGFRYDVFFLLALVVGIGLDFLAGYTRFFLKILFTSTGIMLVTFLIWYCFFDISTTMSVFGFSGAVSTFHPESCLAFAQNVSGHHRLQATFGGPIRFSVFVVTVYFLALGFFSENIRKKGLRYITTCVMSVIVFVAVFYSYSKTSYLGLGAGLVLYALLHARYSRIKISKKYLSLTLVGILAIMGIIVVTHAELFMHLGAIIERQSNLTRTWYMFLHEPFGYGLGAAGPASQIQGGNGFFDFSASGSGFLPENWYLQILIEQGIVGFGIFIILMGMIVRALWKILLIQKNPYSIGLFVSFCVLLFMGLFTHVFEEAATSYVLFLLIGIHLSQKLGK